MRMEGDHNHHGDSDECSDVGMRMTFHGGYCETLLFDQWRVTCLSEMVGSCVAIFVMAATFELVKQYREHCFITETVPEATTRKMLRRDHLYHTVLHVVQYTLAYFVMLILMSFNYWLMLVILLGAVCGYVVGKICWPRDSV